MNISPKLLENPSDSIFNLSEAEIYSIKEVNELIDIEHYAYSLFAIWNCVITNIQRRIEEFGIETLLKIIDEKENFNKNGNTLKDRWLNVNEYKTISYARKLNIINHIAHDLITTLYWMKMNTNEEENKKIDKEEIFSIIYLLEKNLFLKIFKKDMRINKTDSNYKRRKNDQNQKITKPTTHNELLLKTGVKVFEQQQNDTNEEEHVVDEYG